MGRRWSRRAFLRAVGTTAAAAVAGPITARGAGASARRVVQDLDAFIWAQMRTARVPALSAAVVRGDEILWAGGYGTANIAHGIETTPHTVFMLASISKTITGVAVMQAVEDGLIDLDADVNGYLPFPVRNPGWPDAPITTRMLLTHTSSLTDNWGVLDRLYVRGDSPIPLGDFLRDYFTPGAQYYSAKKNFAESPPLTQYRYCNMAVSLAAYLVESTSGTPFHAICHRRIFGPLGMDQTSWHLAGLDPRQIAMPYTWDTGTNDFEPAGLYGYPDYPDGALRTSALQLARHLMAFIGFGELDGIRVLQPETVAEMRRVQFPEIERTQGLIWFYQPDRHGMTLLGHDGGDVGVSTTMFFRPEDGVGVIVLTTCDAALLSQFYALHRVQSRLFALATPGSAPEPTDAPFRSRRALPEA